MRKSIIVLALILSGCLPGGIYYRVDTGLRGDANPQLLKQVEIDKAICQGQASKAALAGNVSQQLRTDYELAVRGCMAERGWIVKPN